MKIFRLNVHYIMMICLVTIVAGCGKGVILPTESVTVLDRAPVIYPDYSAITIPPNIAPLHFEIKEEGKEFITSVSGKEGIPLLVAGKTVRFELAKWKELLAANKGEELRLDIYAKVDQTWFRYQPLTNTVSQDPIDSWLAYRLIEPGYEFFNTLTLNQRNIETFEERVFARNTLVTGKMCINCHSFQNRETQRYLFHTRNKYPGTVLVDKGKARKVDLKPEGLFSNCAYPAWHPTENLVAFSVNKTFQNFHSQSSNRIEVTDELSDLVLYDVEKNEIVPLLQTPDDFETFPTWSQDGKYLYYCNASLVLPPASEKDEIMEVQNMEVNLTPRRQAVRKKYQEFKYNLMRLPYDSVTRQFGPAEMVVDAGASGKSVLHPRVTPDNRYILVTMCDYGTFPIWHPESDLYLVEVATGSIRALDEVNSSQSDSYHTWDSSGRWFVFSSRRDDGSFTRLYFAHFDENGMASKPFLLPQRDPHQNISLMRSYNVPEMIREPVRQSILKLMTTAGTDPAPRATIRLE